MLNMFLTAFVKGRNIALMFDGFAAANLTLLTEFGLWTLIG